MIALHDKQLVRLKCCKWRPLSKRDDETALRERRSKRDSERSKRERGVRERERKREGGRERETRALELWDLDQSGFEVKPLPSYIKPFIIVLKLTSTCRCFVA